MAHRQKVDAEAVANAAVEADAGRAGSSRLVYNAAWGPSTVEVAP